MSTTTSTITNMTLLTIMGIQSIPTTTIMTMLMERGRGLCC